MELIREDDLRCMQHERVQRGAIIAALYRRRLDSPGQPTMSLPEMEQLLGAAKADFEFSLWYLTDGQFIKRSDNGHHSILMKGVDLAELMMDRGLLTATAA
ncbi:MAG TPA: hypothetical protein VGP79_01205 [Bryobacteraceae bacterium]|jgi:hypothetical protein|nr:hypothetical protein [Bryobacteraceae bacterium]